MAAETNFGKFHVLLLDIEGTVCPISFVKDVLFPYALQVLPKFLNEQWDEPSFAEYRNAFPEEYRNDTSAFEAHVRDLVARDVKASYLKALQGYLWKKGYESGVLRAPLFPDVPPFITKAHAAGKKIMIYSSGSVPAQKLFFAHTTAQPPDMSVLISDWFDTVNAGPKTDVASYTTILSQHPDISPARWIFLSDNLNEVDAARQSGMHGIPAIRPGNAPLPSDHPLSEFALSEFTPASVAQAAAAIASKGSA
ncbi:2,3-diketo-5-methylthio-1-phosphopentane phosphatase [Trichoderma arundinaceum]|uniref:Enolase-phosphatase E1 n=1 Tax=Trichoderma arundinaceum TaxID=490622 RepID=A0A395N725_TRIAR|nr:2,3-diketo-5-methylthio-1-phosphopentane phosphatase [Trichoderma arundinaceum]